MPVGPALRPTTAPRSLALAIVGVGLLVVVAAVTWVFVEFRIQGRSKAIRAWESRLEVLADGRKRAIRAWLAERRADADLLAWDPDLIGLCAEGTCPKGYDPEMLRTHLDNLRRFAGFLGAYIFTPGGEPLLVARGGREPSPSAGIVARRVAQEGRYLLHDVHREAGGTPVIGFLAPVFSRGGVPPSQQRGPVLGVVGLYLDPRDTLFPLVRGAEALESPVSTCLVRRDEGWAEVFAPGPKPGGELPRVSMGDPGSVEVAALETKESVGWFRDYRGRSVLGAVRWISEAGWGLVTVVGEEDALAAWRRDVLREAVLLAAGLLCLCLGTVAGWRTWASRRYRLLLGEIRDREERLRALAQGSDDMVFVKDLSGRFLLANPATCGLLGASADEVRGRTTADFLPAAVAKVLQAHDEEAVRGGLPFHGEENIPVAGEARTFLSARIPIRDAGGQVCGVAGVLRDITGRKRNEEALKAEARSRRRAEERLRRLHDSTAGLTGERLFRAVVAALAQELRVRWAVVMRVDGGASAVPLAAVEDGRPIEIEPFDLEGTPCRDVVRSGEPAYHPAAVAQRFPGSPFFRERAVEAYIGVPLTESSGAVIGLLCALHDRAIDLRDPDRELLDLYGRRVSGEVERILAEHRLATARQTLETLIHNLPGAVYRGAAAPERPVEYISDGCQSLFGYRSEDFAGAGAKGVADLVVAEDRARVWREIETASAAGRPWEVEYRVHDAAGAVRWVADVGRAVRDAETGEVSLEGVLFDYTEKHSLEDQLTHSQRMEALGRLAGGVAHDFNNLLTAITGYAEMLLMRLSEEPRLSSIAESIVRSADRGAKLTRQLLAFDHHGGAEPKAVDFTETVRGAVEMFARILGEDVELSLLLDPQAGVVRADPSQLEQVVLNLAVNARDAMPNGGRLAIRTRAVDTGSELAIPPDLAPGRYALLEIEDSGSGIEPEVMERLFEPFFTTKGEGQATGLGLANVYGIVRQGGGQVGVDSEPGRGSTFRVYWPLWRDSVESGTDSGEPRGQGETVLVVEDEEDVRRVLAEHLQDQGYRVRCYASPDEALAAVSSGLEPDLVVSDVVMPRMNGPELVRRLRERKPGLPAVLLSGHAGRAADELGDGQAEWAFLQKPFRLEDLSRAVAVALSQPS